MSYNLRYDKQAVGERLAILSFIYHLFILCALFFGSSTILAEGAETVPVTESYSSNNEEDADPTDAVLEEQLATECLWLACDQKIAVATR